MSSQPAPSGNGREVLPFVIRDLVADEGLTPSFWIVGYLNSDLQERAVAGEKKYGVRLKTFNGRDALLDAYEESQDLVMYLAQALLEEPFDNRARETYRAAKSLALQLAEMKGIR